VSGVNIAAEMQSSTPEALRERGSFKWTAGKPGQIGAFVAESDLPMAPAVRSAVAEGLGRGLTGYLPEHLERAVGAACAGFQQARFGWQLDPDSVRVLPNVLSAFAFTAEHLVDPDTPIVLPTPAYMPFLVKPRLMHRELRTVPMRKTNSRYLLDPDELTAALDGGGLLILVNPHNPTGQVATRDELLAIAGVVERTGSTVFADEIHSPVVFPGAGHLPYAALSAMTGAHTVTGFSASKGWNLPGLTCAQLIMTSPVHRKRWDETHFVAKVGTSPLGAVAACAAYTAGVDHLDEVVRYLDDARMLFARSMATALPDVPYTMPAATYIHWLDLRPLGVPPAEVADRVGVLGTDGADCGAPGFLRLTLATSHPIVTETVHRLSRLSPG
jgi:cystathionine beta-lyase